MPEARTSTNGRQPLNVVVDANDGPPLVRPQHCHNVLLRYVNWAGSAEACSPSRRAVMHLWPVRDLPGNSYPNTSVGMFIVLQSTTGCSGGGGAAPAFGPNQQLGLVASSSSSSFPCDQAVHVPSTL